MKKILIGLVVIIALGAGALYYLSSNVGQIIKSSVETYVPDMIGADVKLGQVILDV